MLETGCWVCDVRDWVLGCDVRDWVLGCDVRDWVLGCDVRDCLMIITSTVSY